MMTFVYIILGLIVLFLGLQAAAVLAAKRAKGTRLSGLKGSLKPLEKNGSKGLVYFYSPSCHACKTVTPVIKEMQKRNSNVFDIDISRDMQTARVFGIKATPTTVVVRDGIIRDVVLGARPKPVLEKLLPE